MSYLLTQKQESLYNEFISFAKMNVVPFANQWDREEKVPREIINLCAEKGYLGTMVPKEYGGLEWDSVTYGLFNEAIGGASISLSGLFNVHTMVEQTILKWGTEKQKQKWLPLMAKGEIIGAFALTEPEAGSDIQGIEAEYSHNDKGQIVLNGKKRWITFGALADILLVFGKLDGKPTAYLVERESNGVTTIPVKDMLGFRAAYLGVLEFNNCLINDENIIGKSGFAFSHIAPYALEFGRISVALSALGIIKSCIEICSNHASTRKTFGKRLIDHGVIGEMITDMGIDLRAAELLCLDACKDKDEHNPDATEKVMIAKYFTSRAAVKHASNAVQIMGALGCNENFGVSRLYRDAKTLEIIEGSTQIHQMILGKSFARKINTSFKERHNQ